MVSAHALLETVLCTTPGCGGDAEYASGLCDFCERERLRRRPHLTLVPALAPDPPDPLCRIDGCEAPILGPTRGRYANLCGAHSEYAKGRVGRVEPPPAKPSPEPPKLTLVERAENVEAAQERVEYAKEALDAAERALEYAVNELREALGFLP